MVRFVFLVLFALSLVSCATTPDANELAEQTLPPPSLEKIADGVWIHKSYKIIGKWGPVLSQGLVMEKNGVIFLIDTAWTNDDTEILLTLIDEKIGGTPSAAIITHAHADKMGGVSALRKREIDTHALRESNKDARPRGLTPTEYTINPTGRYTVYEKSSGLSFYDQNYYPGKRWFHVFYPGAGHTRDNIVVYYAPAKVLFGGCLIRPGASTSLGNTADADINAWAETVRKVAREFPEAEIVVPSHGAAGGRELLDHTIALAEAATNN